MQSKTIICLICIDKAESWLQFLKTSMTSKRIFNFLSITPFRANYIMLLDIDYVVSEEQEFPLDRRPIYRVVPWKADFWWLAPSHWSQSSGVLIQASQDICLNHSTKTLLYTRMPGGDRWARHWGRKNFSLCNICKLPLILNSIALTYTTSDFHMQVLKR